MRIIIRTLCSRSFVNAVSIYYLYHHRFERSATNIRTNPQNTFGFCRKKAFDKIRESGKLGMSAERGGQRKYCELRGRIKKQKFGKYDPCTENKLFKRSNEFLNQ